MKLIAVDLDKTLCEGEFWGEGEPKPIKKAIKKVNKLYLAKNCIIIYTARLPEWYRQTEAWLIKNGVLFHGLRMGKLGADIYFDDKAEKL